MKRWLKKRPCLSLRCLEKQAGLPIKTLDHFVAGRRKLNEHHIKQLEPILKFYGFEKANEREPKNIKNWK